MKECGVSIQDPLKTAVLFLVFNRLDETVRVFEAIRKAKPPRLYLASDGARLNVPGETKQVEAVRDYLMSAIDWDCEINTLFRDSNLGCKYAVSSAITWFFENEEQGIILEDDCLPSTSFFWFCEGLLDKYKDDLRVWLISGDNFQDGVRRGDASYYFSKFNHIWGWASWATRWSSYDVEMKTFEQFSSEHRISSVFSEIREQNHWMRTFSQVYQGKIDTWDYQWNYTVLSNNGLSVIPNINLISNIGYGAKATHTTSLDSPNSNIPRSEFTGPLKHPRFIIQDMEADAYTASKFFKKDKFFIKLVRKVKNIVSHYFLRFWD